MIATSKMKKVELEALVMELSAKVEATNKPDVKPDNLRIGLTLALGCGIPLLSLAMSKIGGTLLLSHTFLSLFAFGLMLSVLAVSLPHLRWAIADITKSEPLPSWCLAIALDLSLVLCELVHVYAQDMGLNWLVMTVMATVAIASAVLNCWAFIKSPTK